MSPQRTRASDGTALLMWSAVLALGVLAAYLAIDTGVTHPPGVLCPDTPKQSPATTAAAWRSKGYRVTPLADFSLRALVLANERYYFDRGADLSPVDFVLGWSAMSDEAVVGRLSISQGRRLASWAVKYVLRFANTVTYCALIPEGLGDYGTGFRLDGDREDLLALDIFDVV